MIAPLIVVYGQGTGQSFSTGVTTRVNYETKFRDTFNAVTTGANWVYTAPFSGVHLISARLLFTNSTAWAKGETAGLYVYRSGVYTAIDYWSDMDTATTAAARLLRGMYIGYLDTLDQIFIAVNQASGATQTSTSNSVINRVEIIAWPSR